VFRLLQSNELLTKAHTLASPNYGYEKRQRELAKKKKKEDKLNAKTHRKPDDATSHEPTDRPTVFVAVAPDSDAQKPLP
jgi:hypothetical protein